MADLNKMYPGVANSPETYLKENVAPEGTAIYVNDASVLGNLPTLAVIGTDQNAETVLVKSVRSDGGLDIQRAVEGLAKRWDKATVVARNFTNYDYKILKENIELLNSKKIESGDLKTRLSEMISDSTHRTVTDTEKETWDKKVDSISGKSLSTNDFTDDFKSTIESLAMKDTPSSDFNSVSKLGIYNGSFSSNCPVGSGKYTLFVFPTDSSTQHQQNYMFQIAVKDNVDDTPYFRLRRGSTTWGKWYKYSSNDYTDTDKAKVTAIPANPKYTDTTYNNANQSYSGLMSSSDKRKLDGLKPVTKQEIKNLGFPEHVVLTESAYNALSSTQKNASDIFYYIKA